MAVHLRMQRINEFHETYTRALSDVRGTISFKSIISTHPKPPSVVLGYRLRHELTRILLRHQGRLRWHRALAHFVDRGVCWLRRLGLPTHSRQVFLTRASDELASSLRRTLGIWGEWQRCTLVNGNHHSRWSIHMVADSPSPLHSYTSCTQETNNGKWQGRQLGARLALYLIIQVLRIFDKSTGQSV